MTEREQMEYDVVIVGGGPAGLSAAIRLRQLAAETGADLSVCILEKGSEIGAHILSGAIMDVRALNELLPDWQNLGAPLDAPVLTDQALLLKDAESALDVPHALVPKPMRNDGHYVVSLGNVCRWLASQAENLGVEIFPGFPAAEIIYENDVVVGVATVDMGRGNDGVPKVSFEPGIELRAKYTLFAEGSRGHLGKQLIERFKLDADATPQHYGLGLKELWEIDSEQSKPGLVMHGAGWPLSESKSSGGFFLYHLSDNLVTVGLIADLNYQNPYFSPFEEFQRLKYHPEIKQHLAGGRRVAYGARAITKGGYNSLPKMTFPGGLLIGCDAGTLNFAKIKGIHTAMKSGMLAAESVIEALCSGDAGGQVLSDFSTRFAGSWVCDELYRSRNFGPALHKFGLYAGAAFNYLDQNWFGGKLPLTLKDELADHQSLQPADTSQPITYPKPDGVLSFDRLSSVYLSNTNHEEDQPCHLTLKQPSVAIDTNLAIYAAPEQRYCPAGVYEIVEDTEGPRLQINAQNCVHCKTCDIKDPSQNIVWVVPEGGGGPNYTSM